MKTLLYILIILGFTSLPATAQVARIKKPKLIVTLVIDQFRADQLARFQNRFLPPLGAGGEPGGFRYLMERGAYYPQAEYGLLQNMTGPGHATILSGAYAYQHAIPVNIWYDQATRKPLYCVEDPASPLVGGTGKRGISPKNFQGSTLGDELKNSGYQSRVISIALKDRAAVLMGGARADLALWFDGDAQSWISSRYYAPQGTLPEWVQKLNADLKKSNAGAGTATWELPGVPASGTSWASNRFVLDSPITQAIGREFPHQSPRAGKEVLNLPQGTIWTTDAGIAALEQLKLGQGPDTDILAISFSNHDFISHSFGPNSRELEELTVVEDREIARLFAAIQKSVGLDKSVIVMTGDHGGLPSTEWLRDQKVDAGRVDQEALRVQGEAFLAKTFGTLKEGSWLPMVVDFNFYLNRPAIKAKGLDHDTMLARLSRFFREEAKGMEGVLHVFTAADVRARTLPPGLFQAQILHTYHAARSGDVMMILKPHYVTPGSTAEHLSGYTYDRMVPLLLAGPQIKPGIYGQKAEVIDIAPTLAFFAGTLPPASSEGRVLHEILRD